MVRYRRGRFIKTIANALITHSLEEELNDPAAADLALRKIFEELLGSGR